MTKMATLPIYGKNPSKSCSPELGDRFPRNLVCCIGDFLLIIICSNDDPGLALTYLTTRSNFVTS